MRSAGWAIAREIWDRNRITLLLVLGYLLAVVVLVHSLKAGAIEARALAELTIPLWFAVPFLMALFSHGDQADIVGRESGYPRRSFTLPIPAAALAGWPMALGTLVIALYWLALAGLIYRPGGVPVPVLWPAVALAALLAWMQALTWFPFPLPFLRIIVVIVVLGGMASAAVYAHGTAVSTTVLLTVSAALLPLAYLTGVAGVARARRGDTPVWKWPALRLPALFAPRPFASATDALFWIEWRRNGFILPLMVGGVIGPQMLLLYYADSDGLVARFLVSLAVCPPLLATAAGASLGNNHPSSRKTDKLPPFLAARPVPTAAMIGVKLRAAFRTTLVTWAIVVLVTAAVLPFSAAGEILAGWVRRLLDAQGVKGWAILLLIAVGLPALTWKWVVNQFWFPLTGRRWIATAMCVALPVVITGIALVALWIEGTHELHAPLRDAVPWIVGAALLLKLAAGAVVTGALLRRRLLTPMLVVRLAVVWFCVAAVLIGLALWLMPAEVYSPWVVGCAAVVLFMPLVRLGLAPLALEWNRHR